MGFPEASYLLLFGSRRFARIVLELPLSLATATWVVPIMSVDLDSVRLAGRSSHRLHVEC